MSFSYHLTAGIVIVSPANALTRLHILPFGSAQIREQSKFNQMLVNMISRALTEL
jgi:hypothetical protein